MNKLKSLIVMLLGLVLILASANAKAIIINPDASQWANDAGVETFAPGAVAVTIELLDVFDPLSTFGFYFVGSDVSISSNLITIFDASDSDPFVLQAAVIDFTLGEVFDADDPNNLVLENFFTPSLADIGFFLDAAGDTIFTEAALNLGGVDQSATFTSLFEPNAHLLAFGDPFPVGYNMVMFAAPEPSTLVLLLLTLPIIGFVASRRRV